MQMQVRKDAITDVRVVDAPPATLSDGQVRVRVDRFGYSANNVTYAAAGDTLGYWTFFPPAGETEGWGVAPVWGFGDVVESRCEEIAEGERLFGYFPPAGELIVEPRSVGRRQFMDGSAHRAKLPAGYNAYRRVPTRAETGEEVEDRHMLLYPLYVTSWCLWDMMADADWYGARRVVVPSASSKTAIGFAFAMSEDENAPRSIGLTSARNRAFVEGLGLYDEVRTYDEIDGLETEPTAIVDMSGNADLIARLHVHLGDAMMKTLDVGLTHWEAPRRAEGRIRERSEFFFAPAHIQRRIGEWGAAGFAERTQDFMSRATADSRRWLELEPVEGLEALAKHHPAVCDGTYPAQKGLVVTLG